MRLDFLLPLVEFNLILELLADLSIDLSKRGMNILELALSFCTRLLLGDSLENVLELLVTPLVFGERLDGGNILVRLLAKDTPGL